MCKLHKQRTLLLFIYARQVRCACMKWTTHPLRSHSAAMQHCCERRSLNLTRIAVIAACLDETCAATTAVCAVWGYALHSAEACRVVANGLDAMQRQRDVNFARRRR